MYVPSYCYTCVRILLYVSSYCCMCPDSYCYICVLIQVREKVDGTALNRIAVKQPLPKVNAELADQIMQRKAATEALKALGGTDEEGSSMPLKARDKEQVG